MPRHRRRTRKGVPPKRLIYMQDGGVTYRLLQEGEFVREGDQFKAMAGHWMLSGNWQRYENGWVVPRIMVGLYRRRVTTR